MTLSIVTCEAYATSLQNPSIDVDIKVKIVSELRDSIDVVQTTENPRILSLLMPAFQYILSTTPPVFISTQPLQKLRNIILEIIHRFPMNDSLLPYVPALMDLLMTLLKKDNEENAVICLKVISELHKSYRHALEDQAQPFLEIVKEMYDNMAKAVRETFDDPTTSVSDQPVSPAADAASESQRILAQSLFSFKVLTECPIIIALLFSHYKKIVSTNVPLLVPQIIQFLTLQPAAQKKAHEDAAAKGTIFVGVAPDIKNRAAYVEFKALQIKTVSFIAYILRMFQQQLRPHEAVIADTVVGLLRDSPPEASATRKELLIATRHIWFADFRSPFVRHIDVLLNEDVLIGTGVTARETLRPLAHSVLLDLVVHVRAELSRSQLSRIIHMYIRNLHDSSFAPNIQAVCARLLLNMVDCLSENGSTGSRDGRDMLIRILDAFALKFTALSLSITTIMKSYHRRKSQNTGVTTLPTESFASNLDMDGFLDLGYAQPIRTSAKMLETSPDIIKDIRNLLKCLILGFKPILHAIRSYNAPPAVNPADMESYGSVARGFSEDEVIIFVRILRDGLKCFDYYNVESFGPDGLPVEKAPERPPMTLSKEDKEVFEAFAAIFTYVEPSVFQEVFSSQIPFLFERFIANPSLQALPQYLLGLVTLPPTFQAAQNNFVFVAPNFAGLLLRYLVDRLDMLGAEDQVMSGAMLRLFKVVFMAVVRYPEKIEAVLRPHVGSIIMKSMKLSSKAKDPLNYFQLLRSLFRSIGGGRFEQIYQEVLPLLEVLLEGLNALLATAQKPQMRELFVELCLTVPVRLSVLLPYLGFLMKPLVLALQAGPELVSQGLRTLELCIDNLTQDFLEPILSPVISDLMAALWRHLCPLPYKTEHSHTTMRILGKLGGRNRRLLNDTANFKHKLNMWNGLEVMFQFNQSDRPQILSLDQPLSVALKVLESPNSSAFDLIQSFNFARACLPLLFDVNGTNGDFSVPTDSLFKSNESAMDVDKVEPDPSDPYPFINPPLLSRDKKEAYDNALSTVISMFFSATAIPSLQEQAVKIIADLCHHFALICLSESIDEAGKNRKTRAPPQTLDLILNAPLSKLDGFIDAVVKSITSEQAEQCRHAMDALKIFTFTCRSLLASTSVTIDELQVFRTLAARFNSCCYRQEWFKKSGGCRGISILTSQLDLGVKWMLEQELEFVKALLYVLKDSSPEMAPANYENATAPLIHILKVCNSSPLEPDNSERQSKFNSLIALLISELSNSSSAVRETIQSSFQLLAEMTGTDVTELLSPVRDRLLSPIFSKPLRALPFAMQIGHIDAITYCLVRRPPLIAFTDELVRLLHEALALADAEDQALVNKPGQYKNSASLTNLRIVCIKLLSAAMACQEFSAQKQLNTRGRIIAVFFKSLYSKSAEVVDVAYKGLQQVLQQTHKLPKDLLQAGLRPILVNLSDYKRLTVSGLEGLARLLELLTNYFKVEIGRKLLDHLRLWAEPAVMEDASGKPLSEIEPIKIMASILNVFHLLPPTANVFLDDLVKNVLELETALRRTISSPFRAPLIRFLNRYATESLDYFLDRLTVPGHAKLFVGILNIESAGAIRQELHQNPQKLIEKTFSMSEGDIDKLHMFGVILIQVMLLYYPDWLLQYPELVAALRLHWARIRKRHTPFDQGLLYSREYQCVLEIFIKVCRYNTWDVEILFEMIDAFHMEEIVDLGFLKNFLYEDIALNCSSLKKKAILEYFLDKDNFDKQTSIAMKTTTLRFLITPMLLVSFNKNEAHEIMDAKMIESIHSRIWHPSLTEPQDQAAFDDFFKVELLQLTTLLVQFGSSIISESRRDVIKFAWNHLKVDDVTCKQAAYVLLARFIEQYDTPAKIVIQIFVALLRAHQAEARVLVKQALDILTPVLPRRITPTENNEARIPTWVRWTRKTIVEDGHSISQLVTIYQLLIRHADLFYRSKDHFVPQIVSSLHKLCFSSTATLETKVLSVELSELLLAWERQRISEVDNPHAMEDVQRTSSDSNGGDPLTGFNAKDILIGFVIQFSCTPNDNNTPQGLTQRCIELMQSLLELWPDVNVKFSHFEKAASLEVTDENALTVCNAINVLSPLLDRKSSVWLIANISSIQMCLENWIKSENILVVKALYPVFHRIYRAIAEHRENLANSDVSNFLKMVDGVTSKGLANLNNFYSIISLISAGYEFRPNQIEDRVLSDLMKMFQKLTKEYLSTHNQQQPVQQQPATPIDALAANIVKMLGLLKLCAPNNKDHRKNFIDCLIQLITETTDQLIISTILDIVKGWVAETRSPYPTMKEKASVMVKMLVFEHTNDKKFAEDFLNLVSSIYTNPDLNRSELTIRLERAFFWGARADDPLIRRRFCDLLSSSIDPVLFPRLQYIFTVQNWESLGQYFWLKQALDLILGCVNSGELLSNCASGFRLSCVVAVSGNNMEVETAEMETDFVTQKNRHRAFLMDLRSMQLKDLLEPLRELIYSNTSLTASLWVEIFPLCWSNLHFAHRQNLTRELPLMLSKEYHWRQASLRPNVIQILLEGFCKCLPHITLPPHLVKFLGKTYNAWYTALEMLQNMTAEHRAVDTVPVTKEEEKIREATMDHLGELLWDLSEDDYYFGLVKRRCMYAETNAAASYEQNGMWAQAELQLEQAQTKARTGVLPFTESEYNFWEEHWVHCAKRLQQWDVLTDLARTDNNTSLLLECAWRLSDWMSERDFIISSVQALPEVGSRKKVFEAFLALQNIQAVGGEKEKTQCKAVCDSGIQLALKEWFALPQHVSNAHIPILHMFQQFVELQEAAQMQDNLAGTTISNIDVKAQDLKGILLTWRERLPNLWDDIDIWSDLVAWRQHVFTTINKAYLPLIQQMAQPQGNSNPTSSYAYRGYHETAWIINRFSHVARKHQLIDVCVNSLSKIYTLPNIEIPEAFYKLREQAKCHFNSPSEYSSGLDVINNTNLQFFSNVQRAEFFTLKGVFLSKLNLHEDATQAFASAIQIEMKLPKAWAAWGQYNDRMFKEQPKEIKYGVNAVTCYLQAAGLYNNARSRKYLARILWLLHLDDQNGVLAKAHETFKGEVPLWYWITFIPQLLTALANKEAKYAKTVLMKLAKSYPQALHFQLRTAKEDYSIIKKQAISAAAATKAADGPNSDSNSQQQNSQSQSSQSQSQSSESQPQSQDGSGVTPMATDGYDSSSASTQTVGQTQPQGPQSQQAPNPQQVASQQGVAASTVRRQPWEYVEEVMALLKTAFPLLALSMETMVDQISQRLKPTTDEDIYRLIVALLGDGVSQLARNPEESEKNNAATEANLNRFADSMTQNHHKYKPKFEEDFIKNKPNLSQLVDQFRSWRDKLEVLLDSRPKKQHLNHYSHYLVEFEYQKFDEIEVPGQYCLLKENNKDFVRIDRFEPEVDVVRGHSSCYRRLTIRGHDGSLHPFNVQHPAARHCRREERTVQLFRILNSILERKKESRRRNLSFQLPIIVPLAPMIRLVQDDPSYSTLQSIYEEHCAAAGFHKDDPMLFYVKKMRESGIEDSSKKTKVDQLNLKTEIMDAIAKRYVPDTILSRFIARKMDSYTDLWLMRKNFTSQMAAVSFMTYVLSVGQRHPQKFFISTKTGKVWMQELLPTISNVNLLFSNTENVPFRLTPNIFRFITPLGMEGVFPSSLMAIARSLIEPEYELEDFLSIFVKDELITWQQSARKPPLQDAQLRELVGQNVELFLKRAQSASCKAERDRGGGVVDGGGGGGGAAAGGGGAGATGVMPANQTVLDLISQSSNPLKLAQMDVTFLATL